MNRKPMLAAAKAILMTLAILSAREESGEANSIGMRMVQIPAGRFTMGTESAALPDEWTKDRWQLTNLADQPEYQPTLAQLRARLDRWMAETHDQGPESEKMYDSDMAVYLADRGDAKDDVTRRNIALMKLWAKEGK